MPTAKGDEIFPDSMEQEFQMLVSEAIAETKVLRALQQIARVLNEENAVEAHDDLIFDFCKGAHDFEPSDIYNELPTFTTDQALLYLAKRTAKLEPGK